MIDVLELIQTFGLLGIFLTIFSESGLLIGILLPGDSLLFTAGLLASEGYFNIVWLVIVSFAAAVIGDNVGYSIGKRAGPAFFNRPDSIFFHKDYPAKAKLFYEKHGGKAIILARFTPLMRTLIPLFAGVARMDYKTFFFYNIGGGAIWAVGLPLLGYTLGQVIPDADRYILPIVGAIVVVSLVPAAFEYVHHRRGHKSQVS